jgi:hypothetical protein
VWIMLACSDDDRQEFSVFFFRKRSENPVCTGHSLAEMQRRKERWIQVWFCCPCSQRIGSCVDVTASGSWLLSVAGVLAIERLPLK